MEKNIKGITLIALVVTIIVLLILAGIAINLSLGNNGLFVRAQNAKTESEIAEVIESARMDIMSKEAEQLRNITEAELENILKKYGILSNKGEATILDKMLVTSKGNNEIEVKRIYDGPFFQEKSIATCTIEGIEVEFELGIKWDEEFMNLPVGEGSVFDILGANSVYGFDVSNGSIYDYKTSQNLYVELFITGKDDEPDIVVNWGDSVQPSGKYYWKAT